MEQVSVQMIEDVFSETVPEQALLCTITAEGLEEPLNLTNWEAGIVSNLITYEFFPFNFAWGGASETEPIREAKLEIANTDGRIANAVRTATGNPRVDVMLIKVASPDDIELALVGALTSDVEIDDPKVIATLRCRSFAQEPACKARYIAARVPGLF